MLGEAVAPKEALRLLVRDLVRVRGSVRVRARGSVRVRARVRASSYATSSPSATGLDRFSCRWLGVRG